jgi:ElaB/YqjD/DUF883 family membrane-anchored ribosome-binding protein
VADLLKENYVPGLVSIVFLLVLAFFITQFLIWRATRGKALREAKRFVTAAKGEHEFLELAPKIDQRFAELSRSSDAAMRSVAMAWSEYRETNVVENRDGAESIRNALRPSMFFNLEDLGFSPGWRRVVPGLFVSVGLAFTFLGLIAALKQTGVSLETATGGGGDATVALQELLTIASAKFIMSLTGLACSIVFTMVLRHGIHLLEHDVQGFCNALEERLSYVSLEELAMDQLAAIRSQNDHMSKIATELIAEIGRPLREELPAVISKSIAEAMTPVMESVGRVGSEGMGQMVADLSSRFSKDVGEALASASSRLSAAGDSIGLLAERMDESSGRMGSELEASLSRVAKAVEELRAGMAQTAEQTSDAFAAGAETLLGAMNQTLERIGENTAESAEALSKVAEGLVETVGSFQREVEAAST